MIERRKFPVLPIVFLLLCVAMLSGFGCKSQIKAKLKRNLVVWGLWQESDYMAKIFDVYSKQTGVSVDYKKLASVADYEKQLLEALAQGRGPDIFVIHHTWVENKQGIMAPAPAAVVDERAVKEEFVDVVSDDLVRNHQVYALPTSVDTLGLYYNKDIFNADGIASPPRTWTEFQQDVQKITKVNRTGTIEQSAAAMGTAANVNRSMDILQLLMMQSGMQIYDSQAKTVSITGNVAEKALTFYTDFSNKSKKVYTWDLQQDFSIDAFTEGKTAMMINYSYHIPTVRAKNPRLNFAVAPVPQITDTTDSNIINFAAYWPFAVSVSTPYKTEAWNLVRYLTNKSISTTINQAEQVPPARRDSVVDFERDPVLGIFTEAALTAHTWPRPDINVSDTIFSTAIDSVVTGVTTPAESLKRAESQLNQLLDDIKSNQPTTTPSSLKSGV